MSIEDLKGAIPDYAKDIKLNLGSLAMDATLSAQQRAGTFVASRTRLAERRRHPRHHGRIRACPQP